MILLKVHVWNTDDKAGKHVPNSLQALLMLELVGDAMMITSLNLKHTSDINSLTVHRNENSEMKSRVYHSALNWGTC